METLIRWHYSGLVLYKVYMVYYIGFGPVEVGPFIEACPGEVSGFGISTCRLIGPPKLAQRGKQRN